MNKIFLNFLLTPLLPLIIASPFFTVDTSEYHDSTLLIRIKLLSWNAASVRMFGYQADEVIGKPITLLIPSELQEEEEQLVRRLTAGEWIEQFEMVRLAKDGGRLSARNNADGAEF